MCCSNYLSLMISRTALHPSYRTFTLQSSVTVKLVGLKIWGMTFPKRSAKPSSPAHSVGYWLDPKCCVQNCDCRDRFGDIFTGYRLSKPSPGWSFRVGYSSEWQVLCLGRLQLRCGRRAKNWWTVPWSCRSPCQGSRGLMSLKPPARQSFCSYLFSWSLWPCDYFPFCTRCFSLWNLTEFWYADFQDFLTDQHMLSAFLINCLGRKKY